MTFRNERRAFWLTVAMVAIVALLLRDDGMPRYVPGNVVLVALAALAVVLAARMIIRHGSWYRWLVVRS